MSGSIAPILAKVTSYLLAASLIIATPGADVLLAIATSLANGRRSGFAAVLGMASGYLVHAVIAALGIAVLLAGSPAAVRVVQAAGALYLAGAGVAQIRRRHQAPPSSTVLVEPFKRGLFTSLLNPKGALFFLAFLPQFLPDGGGRNAAALGLGLVFSALTVLIYGTYAAASSLLHNRLDDPRTYVALRMVAGLVFIALAINAGFGALHGSPT